MRSSWRLRGVLLYTTVMKRFLLIVTSISLGCGGTGKDGPTTPGGGGGSGSAAKPAAAGEVSLDIPVIEIKGLIFEPEALGRPGMPVVRPKNAKITIDQQKKIFGSERDILIKQARAAELVTLMLDDSKKKTGDEQKKLVLDARQVLRDVAVLAGPKVDELTLRMLGSYEIETIVMHKDGDWATAEKVWEQVVTKGPKDKDLLYNKAWYAYTLLRQYKNAEALAVVKNDAPSDKQPEHAYVTAWAKWRAGDDAGAWQALVVAAAGWGNNANKNVLQHDLLLFAGRSSVPFTQVTPQLFGIFGAKTPADQYAVVVQLGLQAYQFAGKWNEGVAAIDEAFKLAGTTVPPNDKMRLKYYAADFTVRLDQPAASSRSAIESIQSMPACAAPKCTEADKQEVVVGIYGIARLFHLLYATANDIRYYQPAHDLYTETIPLIKDNAMRTQAKADMDTLEKTLKNTKAGSGTHEKQAIGVLMQRHSQEVQACYEDALAANPKLAGTLTVTLESDASGDIKGVATDPKAGVADLSAVAGCAAGYAKSWKLPKRGMAGSTRIKLVYQLSKKP